MFVKLLAQLIPSQLVAVAIIGKLNINCPTNNNTFSLARPAFELFR